MKPRQVLIAITVVLVLFLGLAPALAQQREYPQSPSQPSGGLPSGTAGMPPSGTAGMGGMHMPTPGGGICTDGKYLYVLQGPWIQQYTIPDLKLQGTVELPRPKPREFK